MRYEFLGEKDDASRLEFRALEDCSALDLALAAGMSRRSAARAFQRGELTRGGEVLAAPSLLAAGDVVDVTLARPAAMPTRPNLPPATIIYQDSVCLAAEKPAGILVHGDGTGAPTLTERVRVSLARQGMAANPQAVQRLDVETTGLVLFSLAEEFQPAFDALVAGHAMHKRYLAEVSGAFPDSVTTIEKPIGRDRHDARRMRVCRPGQGQPALTRVRVLERRGNRTLLLVELGTGRHHQIRVHLSSLGFPLVGDALYGGRRDPRGLMLHALEEEFDHPVTGAHVLLRTEVPERFRA
ncbi:MAG: RluA family pseudouridine synthase [Olsenella sp.]|nr:RluA family pseudouridine synthase [Olsenella sp.]MCH3957068.1 RluA family pseudouridine synthase [Olsenella sp.]